MRELFYVSSYFKYLRERIMYNKLRKLKRIMYNN